jgi:hypothetical protein
MAITDSHCVDCEVETCNTAKSGLLSEYYMVKDKLWYEAVPTDDILYDRSTSHNIMLCIGCLEKRLGRKLCQKDFTRCPLNDHLYNHSPRLKNRLQRT